MEQRKEQIKVGSKVKLRTLYGCQWDTVSVKCKVNLATLRKLKELLAKGE